MSTLIKTDRFQMETLEVSAPLRTDGSGGYGCGCSVPCSTPPCGQVPPAAAEDGSSVTALA